MKKKHIYVNKKIDNKPSKKFLPLYSSSFIKKVYSFLALFVLLGIVIAGTILVRNKQDIRGKAFEKSISISSLPKPISGTFLWWDAHGKLYTYEEYNTYFNELKELGIDTVIVAMGSISRNSGQCGDSNFIVYNDLNESTFQNLIKAAHEHNMNIYLGGKSASWTKVCFWSGNPDDPKTDKGFVIKGYLDTFSWAKNQIEQMGYDWTSPNSFVKGFYIGEEKSVTDFIDDQPVFQFYVDLSKRIKYAYPNKKILISPYQQEKHTYQQTYDAMYHAVKNSAIDIYAPQDSVGVKMVTSYQRDYEHYSAMKNAIEKGNKDFGKSIELWANVETFNETGPNIFMPQDFKTLRWQIRAVEENTSKIITWIHNWGMMSSVSGFYPETASQRLALKKDYQNKPIILSVFQWNYNNQPHMFIKGYNFGVPGDLAGLYVHYYSTDGTYKKAQFMGTNMIFDSGLNKFKEIRVNMNQFQNLNWNKPIEVAVQNKGSNWSFYKSNNPESEPDPSFPEIVSFLQTNVSTYVSKDALIQTDSPMQVISTSPIITPKTCIPINQKCSGFGTKTSLNCCSGLICSRGKCINPRFDTENLKNINKFK